jgi:hypothetical protein
LQENSKRWVSAWNVKAEDSSWWIVEGENTPMNLYTQDAFCFSADEAAIRSND